MDEIRDKIKKFKRVKLIIASALILFTILFFAAVIIAIIPGAMNGIQGVAENTDSSVNKGDSGTYSMFSLLCKDCDSNETTEKSGVKGSDYYKKMSELINLYNNLEPLTERDDEMDYPLIVATLEYGKRFMSDMFIKSEKLGNQFAQNTLTNRDIENYANKVELEEDELLKYYKWSSIMLGTPYSLPNINLRGLLGSLVTGRVTTTCISGEASKSEDEQKQDLVKQIISVEKKLSGETVSTSIWDSILSIFGLSYTTDDKVLEDRLIAMLDGGNEDLKAFVNLDNFDMELCPSGSAARHTYTKFMNYSQYKVYLEKVFIPQNFINCEDCLLKDASKQQKEAKIKQIENEIFANAEYSREYAQMGRIDYSNIKYGQEIDGNDLSAFSSPHKRKCSVSSPYGYRDGVLHYGVDTIITESDKSLYAAADGIVESVNVYTTDNLWKTSGGGCALITNDIRNGGVTVVIKHNINGKIYYSEYAHLDPNGINVKAGETVKRGQKVANMGNTGCSSGMHLHFNLFANEYGSANALNPTKLFSQCENSGMSGELKLTTTDNFVYKEKCMVGDYSLDEVIASLIKARDNTLSTQKEAVKAAAIVIRTKLMDESKWCNDKINYSVKNFDIESNPMDLTLYNQVLETQGMVLNYSGEIIEDISYANFPCETLPVNDWYNYKSLVLPKIGVPEAYALEYPDEVVSLINVYNSHCVSYGGVGSNPVSVDIYTIPNDLIKYKGLKEKSENFQIPRSWIKGTDSDAEGSFSLLLAKYRAAQGDDYTEILYRFYRAKAINQEDMTVNHGDLDISTSPGLLDAKKKVSENLKANSQNFKYGETISEVATNYSSGNMSDEELQRINENLTSYVDAAEQKATEIGDINPKRARVLAAAYWLINNPFYKVTYQYGTGNANYKGWNPRWSANIGIECSGFVVWSFIQAGANYHKESDLRDGVRISSPDRMVYLDVEEVINTPGIQIGDIMYQSYPTDANGNKIGNGHWALLYEINAEQCYIITAEAVSKDIGLRFKKMYCGNSSRFNRVYIGQSFYNDDAWKASR